MEVKNALMPHKEQIQTFIDEKDADRGPIFMVNLLKFREKARYEDGRDSDLSGREAYMRYGSAMQGLLKDSGGSIIFSAEVSFLLIGEVGKMWDMVAIAQYPSRRAMREITISEGFQKIEHHRMAGLEGQINIECLESSIT